jgi:hypothetical protein
VTDSTDDDQIEQEDSVEIKAMKPKQGRGALKTSLFPMAKEVGYKVYKRRDNHRFDIYTDGDEPVNEKPLRRKQVEPFIEQLLENEDSAEGDDEYEGDDE